MRAVWDEVDLGADTKSNRKGEASWKLTAAATIYGFAYWWTAELVPGVTLSTAPDAPRTHWEQLYFPLLEPIHAAAGRERHGVAALALVGGGGHAPGVDGGAFRQDGQVEWRGRRSISTRAGCRRRGALLSRRAIRLGRRAAAVVKAKHAIDHEACRERPKAQGRRLRRRGIRPNASLARNMLILRSRSTSGSGSVSLAGAKRKRRERRLVALRSRAGRGGAPVDSPAAGMNSARGSNARTNWAMRGAISLRKREPLKMP